MVTSPSPVFNDEEEGQLFLGLSLHKSFTVMPNHHSQRLLLEVFPGTSTPGDSHQMLGPHTGNHGSGTVQAWAVEGLATESSLS